MATIRHRHILVGIETDPTQYHGENANRPALLDHEGAQQVVAHVAIDLRDMFPAINRCALSMAGALYDRAQVLRPQLPVYGALEKLQQSANPGSDFQPSSLGIGADNGRMPLQELQPFETIPPGSLQILPLLVSGPAENMDEVAVEMEHPFPGQGQLSERSAKDLGTHFQISVNRARFMTITDLSTLLRQQLEYYGFLPLWKLLDAAITQTDIVLEVHTPGGPRFRWCKGAVHSFFESFDWWAKYGSGSDTPASDQQLQSAYVDWTRKYRRYQTVLGAHGVKVSQHLPGLEDVELEDSFLLEESTVLPGQNAAALTEHSAEDLETIAVTVASGNRQMNFYPLQPSGLNDLHRFIRKEGYSGGIAYPGRILYDENSRQLVSETFP